MPRAPDLRPLEGIVTALKDENMMAGKITIYGSVLYADFTPQRFVGRLGSGPSSRVDHSGDGLRHRRLHSHSASACSVVGFKPPCGRYRRHRGWRIAYSLDFGFIEIDRDVRANILRAVNIFRSLGAEVVEVDLPWPWRVYSAAAIHCTTLFGAWFAEYLDERQPSLLTSATDFARKSLAMTTRDYLSSLDVEGWIYAHFGTLMEERDLFRCPTLSRAGGRGRFRAARAAADRRHADRPLSLLGHGMALQKSSGKCQRMKARQASRAIFWPSAIGIIDTRFSTQSPEIRAFSDIANCAASIDTPRNCASSVMSAQTARL